MRGETDMRPGPSDSVDRLGPTVKGVIAKFKLSSIPDRVRELWERVGDASRPNPNSNGAMMQAIEGPWASLPG